MDPRSFVTEFSDKTAIVRFNRPTQRNSLSLSTLQELVDTVRPILADEDVRAIVFTGTDDFFASGADIRELSEFHPSTARLISKVGQTIFQMIADARQVTIAAVSGYCMGGGVDLALSCDIRVSSTSAVFSHPGAKRGIITGWGGTQRLPRIIGRSRALDLFLTARLVRSDEALEMGLVTSVFDPVVDHALELARSCGEKKRV